MPVISKNPRLLSSLVALLALPAPAVLAQPDGAAEPGVTATVYPADRGAAIERSLDATNGAS